MKTSSITALSFCLSLFAMLFANAAYGSTVQLSQTTYSVNETAGHVDIAVSVTRDSNLGQNEVIQVDYATEDGTALAGRDYTAASGALTFTAGVQSLTVSVPIINRPGDNGYPTGNSQFSFVISSPRSNAATQPILGSNNTATVTIFDVDGNRIGFTSTDYQVQEPAVGGANTIRLVVKRYGANTTPAVIHYQTADDTAHAGTDYFAQSGDLNFPNTSPDKVGEDLATQFIDITVLSDSAAAGNKRFTVALTPTNSGGSAQGISTARVTIIDAETSTVRLSSATYSVLESATRVTVAVVRNGNLAVTGTINLSTADGTAEDGRNYIATSRDLTFGPGESAKTVDIMILNDHAITGTLFFTVNLSPRPSDDGFLLGEPASARVSIIDAAPVNTVEFAEADQAVARGTGPAQIFVRLNRAPGNDETVTVQYATSNTTNPQQTAIPGVDYTPVSGTLTFAPGVSIKLIEVPILDATQTFDTRRLVINLSQPSANAILGVSSTLLTILPANSAGLIQFSLPRYLVYENNGTVTLTVLLDRTGDTSRTVTVDYATRVGTAGTNRFGSTSGRLTFANGGSVATISINIVNDSVVQADPQSFFVTLSNPQNGTLGVLAEAEVSIQDDDGLNRVEFDAADYGAVETDGSVLLRVIGIRGSDPNQTLTVNIEIGAEGDTALLGQDYLPPESATVVFPPGSTAQRIAIPIVNRLGPQPSRVFTVKLTSPGPFTTIGRQGQARVTILDDSGPNTLQFLTSAQRFREGSQSAISVTVVRFGDFNANGTNLTFTTEVRPGDTAAPGVNFVQTSGSIEFAPILGTIGMPPRVVVVGNETRKTILIPIPDNALVEGDVTFHLTITGSDVAEFGEITSTQITIEDNDVGNVVQFSNATYTASRASGSALITVLLTPNGDASRASTVNYAATGITAFPGYHFSPVVGTLVFEPGETAKTFVVPVNPDAISSGNLTFRVTLSGPSDGTVLGPTSTAVVTIDNSISSVQFTASNYDVDNSSGSASVSVTLSRADGVTEPFTVGYATADLTAIAGHDYTAQSGTLTFNSGENLKTIVIPLVPQSPGQPSRQFEIRLSNPSAGLVLGALSRASVTISNADLSTKLVNISTRGPVQQGDSVMIAGFIVQGDAQKQIVVRGLGPSLTQFGVTGAVTDTTLELLDSNGTRIAFNDDYRSNTPIDTNVLSSNNLTPTDLRESAVVANLQAGAYTAILRGKTNGIGLVEVYDLSRTAVSKFGNISTRAKVEQNDSGTVIAGFIVGAPAGQPGTSQRVVVRAKGPSLTAAGVTGALADPTLEIYRGAQKIMENDNWRSQTSAGAGTPTQIQATGLAPTNDKEATILATLDPGTYSAIVRGKNNTTGISLVEVYQLQ